MVLVLVSFAVSATLVALVALIAFLDVAFRDQDCSTPVPVREWRVPPPLRGRDLYHWFSATAERVALGVLSTRRDAGAASRVAIAVQQGAAAAGDNEAQATSDPAFCSTRIGVTPPEAIEIASFLRGTQSAPRVESIRQRAGQNEQRLVAARGTDDAPVHLRCPLACEDGTCVAAAVRPVQCRVRCELFGHELDAATADKARRAELLAAGAERGLSRALDETGLNGTLYELNSALSRALAVPDSARRWASGEAVFEGCAAYIGSGVMRATTSRVG